MKPILTFLSVALTIITLNGQMISGFSVDSPPVSDRSLLDSCSAEFILEPVQGSSTGIHVQDRMCWVSGRGSGTNGFVHTLSLFDISTATPLLIYQHELPFILSSGDLYVQDSIAWIVSEQQSLLFKINANTGDSLATYDIPSLMPGDPNVFALTGDGTNLWIGEYGVQDMTTNFQLFNPVSEVFTDTIIVALQGVLGVEYVNGKLYGTGPFLSDSIFVIEPTTGVIENGFPWCLPLPYGIGYDNGDDVFYGSSGGVINIVGEIYRLGGIDFVSDNRDVNRPEVALTLFPNPAKDIIQISGSYKGLATFSLHDAQGRLLKTWYDSDAAVQSVSVAELPAGTYYLRMVSENSNTIRSFVKQE